VAKEYERQNGAWVVEVRDNWKASAANVRADAEKEAARKIEESRS